MASAAPTIRSGDGLLAGLHRPALAIATPRVDALFFWGAPLLALLAIVALGAVAALLPPVAGGAVTRGTVAAMAIVTYAHLIAVAPRAYLNRDVFRAHRARLTIVPVLLLGAMLASTAVLVAMFVLAVFWDVHHSAMQTFGLGRIYDAKAGNDPHALRRVDLWLNAALYIGPLVAGATMLVHLHTLDSFGRVGWTVLTRVPPLAADHAGAIRLAGIVAWGAAVAGATIAYARAAARGYRMSPYKQALLLSTAATSILAWGFASPLVAFMTVNLFHAVQYFALVWVKEGGRIRAVAPRLGAAALPAFVAACLGFGAVYWWVHGDRPLAAGAWLAPFVACSLLHFWYDAFVWSVRRKLV
jgi:hypothetical protein